MQPFIWISIVLLTSIVSATGAEASPETMHRTQIEKLFEAFNVHDLKALASFYSLDAVLSSPDFSKPRKGPGGVRETYGRLFDDSPDIKDCVTNVVVQGNRAAVQFISRSKQPKPFIFPLATFFDFREGMIVSDTTYFDNSRTPSTNVIDLQQLWRVHCEN